MRADRVTGCRGDEVAGFPMNIVDIPWSDLVATNERLETTRIDCDCLNRSCEPRKCMANYVRASAAAYDDRKCAPGGGELARPEWPMIAANVVCNDGRAVLLRAQAVDLESDWARCRCCREQL